MNRNPRHFTDYPIRNDRRDTPCQEFILSFFPPSAHQIIAFIQFFKQLRDIRWIVLQITIHTDNMLSLREFEARCHRRCLAGILLESDNRSCGFCSLSAESTAKVSSVAAVIYEQHFISITDPSHIPFGFFKQQANVLFFVVDGDHDG